MKRCPEPRCEGWLLHSDWSHCPSCGAAIAARRLRIERPVGSGWLPCPLLQGHSSRLVLDDPAAGTGPEVPDWLEAVATAEPGVFELRPRVQAGAELVGQIGWQGWQTPVYFASEFEARLLISAAPHGSQQLSARLEVQRGAAWLEQLPPGWSSREPLPRLLSASHWQFRSLELMLDWSGQEEIEARFGLVGPQGLGWQARARVEVAGQLIHADWLDWDLRESPVLEVSVQARGGRVELEGVLGLPDWLLPVPSQQWHPGEGGVLQLQPVAGASLPDVCDLDLQLQLADGSTSGLRVAARRHPLQPYPGWLLLDFGSRSSVAYLLSEHGRRHLLGEFPSELTYTEQGPLLEQPAEVGQRVELAKRYLGSPGFTFEIAALGQRKSPDEVVGDYFQLLFSRLFELEPLRRHRLERLCLTYPAAFAPRQVQCLRQCIAELSLRLERLADLHIEMLSEPLAATYHFLQQQRSLPAEVWHLLLYDLGGSSSDVAVVRVDSRQASQVQVQVEAVGGDRWFGGQDITRMLAEALPVELRPRAEEIKCSWSGPQPERLDLRLALDAQVDARLGRSLPRHEVQPTRIVLAGRASQYPRIAEWLQQRWPQASLERSSAPKECVALGAGFHPEVVRHLGPRLVDPQGHCVALGLGSLVNHSTSRFGLRVVQAGEARFRSFLDFGEVLPPQGLLRDVAQLAFLPGPNRLELLENLGWDDRLEGPQGQANPHIGVVRVLQFDIDEQPNPEHTRLRLAITPDYRVRLRLEVAGRCLADLGEVSLTT